MTHEEFAARHYGWRGPLTDADRTAMERTLAWQAERVGEAWVHLCKTVADEMGLTWLVRRLSQWLRKRGIK